MSSLPATQAGAKARTEDVELGARGRSVRAELACFALVATAYIAYFLTWGYGRFYWDAREYWRLGDDFDGRTGFSLLSYSHPYRGYSLPLANHGLKVVGSRLGLGDVTTVELTGALLAAALGVVVIPRLARALFPSANLSWWRVLALNALVFLYWRDHFNFPLTDFPALTATCISILALRRRTAVGYVVAGLGLGLAEPSPGLHPRTRRGGARRGASTTPPRVGASHRGGRARSRRGDPHHRAAVPHQPPPGRDVDADAARVA
jgi:hypothetical protein